MNIELYNLKEDISETKDLSKEYPDLSKKLLSDLKNWIAETEGKLPQPNPNVR